MSKAEIIEFKCDVCGKVHRNEYDPLRTQKNPFKTVSIPAKEYDCEGKNFSKKMSQVDMCENCFNHYWEYVQRKYEVSDCYGIEIKVKGE